MLRKCERCGKLIPYSMYYFCNECSDKLLGEAPKPFKPPIENEEKCKNCGEYIKEIESESKRYMELAKSYVQGLREGLAESEKKE